MSGSPDPQASEYLVGAYRPLQNLAARGVAIDSGQTQDKIGEGNKMPGKSVLVLAQFLAVIRSRGIEADPIAPVHLASESDRMPDMLTKQACSTGDMIVWTGEGPIPPRTFDTEGTPFTSRPFPTQGWSALTSAKRHCRETVTS